MLSVTMFQSSLACCRWGPADPWVKIKQVNGSLFQNFPFWFWVLKELMQRLPLKRSKSRNVIFWNCSLKPSSCSDGTVTNYFSLDNSEQVDIMMEPWNLLSTRKIWAKVFGHAFSYAAEEQTKWFGFKIKVQSSHTKSMDLNLNPKITLLIAVAAAKGIGTNRFRL